MNANNGVHILLLAAGASTRMRGTDKLLEKVQGRPLLRLMADRALATGLPLTITLPQRPHPRYDVLEGLDTRLKPVRDAALGMGVSLASGVGSLPKRATKAVLVLLADMPELTTLDMMKVISARQSTPDALIWRGCDMHGKPGHPVLIDASLLSDLCTLKGDQGAQSVVSAHKDRVHLVQIGQSATLDLDTPEAWAAWRHRIGH